MTATEIINAKASRNVSDYTESEIATIKAYGWNEYGLGVKDTLRIELETIDYEAYLDETFC